MTIGAAELCLRFDPEFSRTGLGEFRCVQDVPEESFQDPSWILPLTLLGVGEGDEDENEAEERQLIGGRVCESLMLKAYR